MRTDVVRVGVVGYAARDSANGEIRLIVRAHTAEAQTALIEDAALFFLFEEESAADVVGVSLAVCAVVEVAVVAAASILDDGAKEDAVASVQYLA